MIEANKKGARKQKGTAGLKAVEEVKIARNYEGYILRKFTPEIFSEMVAAFNEEQKKWVKTTGFGDLLHFQMQHYPHRLGYMIAESFDSKSCSLKLECGSLDVSTHVVNKVLGMPNGDKEIEFNIDPVVEDLWVQQFENKNRGKITPRMVYGKMNRYKHVDITFKQNFIVLMSNFLIESNGNGYVNREFLHFKGDLDRCYEFKWCELLLNRLKKSHKIWAYEPSSRHFTGSLPFLIVS